MGLLEKLKSAIYKKSVQYTYMSNYGQPKWSTQNDEQYIREAYNKLVWVYSCISLISHCTSAIPWCLYRKRGKNKFEIEDHPILNIVNINANPYLSSKDFFDMWATYLAIQGKFYAKYNNSVLPTQLEPLYPHFTKPIPDKINFVSGFQYTISGNEYKYNSDEILWSKFFDPSDMYEGLSPIRAMARTIDTENQAVDWNKSTLQNQAVPPGIIHIVNTTPEVLAGLRDEWLKKYGGPKNSRMPLILDAEKVNYTNLGLSPVDMDFLEQRKINRVEICSGFGVPSQLVGDPQGQTYANYKEAQKAFYENTVLPRYIDVIKDNLNNNLCIKYADNLVLEPNLDNIQALHEAIDATSERVRGLWKDSIITRAEARDAIGYDSSNEDKIYYNDMTSKMFGASSNENTVDTTVEDNTTTEDATSNQDNIKKKLYYY